MSKTIIAGSRTITDPSTVEAAIARSKFAVTEVVSGNARGVDHLGESWAASKGLPCTKFPADWKGLGKGAGFLRNAQMAEYGEALIAIWDGESNGTRHMIASAKAKGLPVFVFMTHRWGQGGECSVCGVEDCRAGYGPCPGNSQGSPNSERPTAANDGGGKGGLR